MRAWLSVMSGMSAPGMKKTSPMAPFSMALCCVSSTASGWRRNAKLAAMAMRLAGALETIQEPSSSSGRLVPSLTSMSTMSSMGMPLPTAGALAVAAGVGTVLAFRVSSARRCAASGLSAKKVSPRAMATTEGMPLARAAAATSPRSSESPPTITHRSAGSGSLGTEVPSTTLSTIAVEPCPTNASMM